MGGISEHFIWQVDLVEHFIWKVDLILWLFQMGSHWRYRLGNSWSAVTGSFTQGGISESEPFIWKYELISDVCVHFTLFTSSDNYWEVYLTAYLDTWSKNMNSFWVWVLLHRGLFYERPISDRLKLCGKSQVALAAYKCSTPAQLFTSSHSTCSTPHLHITVYTTAL